MVYHNSHETTAYVSRFDTRTAICKYILVDKNSSRTRRRRRRRS